MKNKNEIRIQIVGKPKSGKTFLKALLLSAFDGLAADDRVTVRFRDCDGDLEQRAELIEGGVDLGEVLDGRFIVVEEINAQ